MSDNYPLGVTDEDIDKHFSNLEEESTAYQRYLDDFKAEAKQAYKDFLKDNDKCTFDEFMEDYDKPQEFEEYMQELEEELFLQAAEARAEYLRDREIEDNNYPTGSWFDI